MTFRPWLCEDSAPAEQKASHAMYGIAWGLQEGGLRVDQVEEAVQRVLEAVRESEALR